MAAPPDIPLRDSVAYTMDEIRTLKGRWDERDTSDVALWLDQGADRTRTPDCVRIVRVPGMTSFVDAPDLRGINLSSEMLGPRTSANTKVALRYARLEFADLSGVNLQGAQMAFACLDRTTLEYAELRGANLWKAGLRFADLRGTHLEDAYLVEADLDDASCQQAFWKGAVLRNANLRGANLYQTELMKANALYANLAKANLREANLTDAILANTDLRGACLAYAFLERASLTAADVGGADLSYVKVQETDFRDVKWRLGKRRLPEPGLIKGLDVRGIRYSEPLFDEFVRQNEFIRCCRESWPPALFRLWDTTCKCGRSIVRWLIMCALLIVVFGAVFSFSARIGYPLVGANSRQPTWLTNTYFSMVTFSTLGFGDVTPCNWVGELLVMVEVFTGYVCLGGLISIFAIKFLPPR